MQIIREELFANESARSIFCSNVQSANVQRVVSLFLIRSDLHMRYAHHFLHQKQR